MPSNAPARIVAGIVSTIVGGLITWLAAWIGGQFAQIFQILAALIAAATGAAFLVVNQRYVTILGRGLKNSDEARKYEELRATLAAGGSTARRYTAWLTKFLDGTERFFGDTNRNHRTWAHEAAGLRDTPALWTAPAYDRCLQLALAYPIAVIFVVWAVTAHVGPAESALELREDVKAVWRYASIADLALLSISSWRLERSVGYQALFWCLAWIASLASVFVLVGDNLAIIGLVFTVAVGYATRATRFTNIVCMGAMTISGVVTFPIFIHYPLRGGMLAGGPLIIAFVTYILATFAQRHKREGAFLAILITALILSCWFMPLWLASHYLWNISGPLLLFLGLLTLLNAPFDWLSLGLTRLLLHLGLQKQGWWPVFYALIDAALATIFILGLTITMVLGIQTFDAIAIHGGGKSILPLDEFFQRFDANKSAPEFWWVYALLLTTMLPSAINLMIGGASLMRGIPWLNAALLRQMPAGRPVPKVERVWVALVLTAQLFLGFLAGIAAQCFLAYAMFAWVFPAVGLNLIGLARELAEADLPARLLF